MCLKLVFLAVAVVLQQECASAQLIPSSMTAAELWNPSTWFYPFAIATAESYRDYYQKAQKATNELYQQIYSTNAFPWITGNWGSPQKPEGQNGQGNQNQQNQETTSTTKKEENTTPSNQPSSTTPANQAQDGVNANVEAQDNNAGANVNEENANAQAETENANVGA